MLFSLQPNIFPSEFVFAFFGQQAKVHRTVIGKRSEYKSAEVNGTKPKSLRVGRKNIPYIAKYIAKEPSKDKSLLGSQNYYMKVLCNDFAAVDFREELCYHSRPKKTKFKRNMERE